MSDFQERLGLICGLAHSAVDHGIGLGQDSLGWDDETDERERNKIRETIDKTESAYDAMLEALKGCLAALNVAIDRSEGDTFGIHHNAAMDAMCAAEKAISYAEGR